MEDAIAKCPGVTEVGVVGTQDEKTAEAVKAFIVRSDPALSENQVIRHCHDHLTNYKVPKHIVFVEEIPKSPAGKVLRRELRNL